MCQLRIHNPMDLNESIWYTAEADTEMEALTTRVVLSVEADAGSLLTAQESSEFKKAKSTRKCVPNMQTEVSTEGKVDTVWAII